MDGNVSDEGKFSDDSEVAAGESRVAQCSSQKKLTLKASFGRPRSISQGRPPRSNSQRSMYGKVGMRKPVIKKAVSERLGRRSQHRRAQTLMHVPNRSENTAVEVQPVVVAELKIVLDGLSEQLGQMEQRFEKKLGAFHKRFEKMEKMQLTILANIRKLAKSNNSPVIKTFQQKAPSVELQQDMTSPQV